MSFTKDDANNMMFRMDAALAAFGEGAFHLEQTFKDVLTAGDYRIMPTVEVLVKMRMELEVQRLRISDVIQLLEDVEKRRKAFDETKEGK